MLDFHLFQKTFLHPKQPTYAVINQLDVYRHISDHTWFNKSRHTPLWPVWVSIRAICSSHTSRGSKGTLRMGRQKCI